MGGYGSGRPARGGRKGTCEGARRIEINYLRGNGLMKPGHSGTLSWSMNGRRTGEIGYRVETGRLVLNYNTRRHGETEWTPVTQSIDFDWTSQSLGGERQWFLCPQCCRRCSVLYGEELYLCRKCQDLIYECQTESLLSRQLSQAQKIREKLGGSTCTFDAFPLKPKGMHWRTYEQIRNKAENIESQYWGAMAKRLGMLQDELS